MKIQCSCGAKYAFDITPEMARQPMRLVCQACGVDISDSVNQFIRQELARTPTGGPVALSATVAGSAPAPAGDSSPHQVTTTAPVVASPVGQPTRLHTQQAKPDAVPEIAEEDALPKCAKHFEPAEERCRICSKPICPKCMELFGYVCSPLCKAKADSHGIHVPVYAAQRSMVEARLWRRVALITGAVCLLGGVFLAVWFWYAWFGSTPKTQFAVRFEKPAYSGQSVLCGADQIVFLHGGTLARHDMRERKQIWTRDLIDRKQIDDAIARETKRTQALIDKANYEGWENVPKMPDPEKLARNMERSAAAALNVRVIGSNIWVSAPEKLARYDWETGNPLKEISLEHFGPTISRSNELLFVAEQAGRTTVTHINLNTCDMREEPVGNAGTPAIAASGQKKKNATTTSAPGNASTKGKSQSSQTAGLPLMPGKDAGKPMDPAKVAEQAQHLPLPAKIALPALIGNSLSQERTLNELNDQGAKTVAPVFQPGNEFQMVPTKDGFVEFSVRLLESRMVQRSAMKAAPGKSADGNMSIAAKSLEQANELLNEMQLSRGGDIVVEDESRYQVTLRSPDGKDSWSGEVIGRPSLTPLTTVNALTANKTLIIFDKTHKKLWQSTLNYNVEGGSSGSDEDEAEQGGTYGEGPIVERKGSLYVFDEGVLTAFDLSTGNVRWRLPSVGIAGIFFDEKDGLYVNTTTASPDSIKNSRQIDVSQKASSVVLKLDSKSGKQVWSVQPGGPINYVSGPYLFSVQSYVPYENEDNPYTVDTGFESSPYLRIKRINPKTGKAMWEHFQRRAPLDVRFDKNRIQLVFKKEVQVLKFMAF